MGELVEFPNAKVRPIFLNDLLDKAEGCDYIMMVGWDKTGKPFFYTTPMPIPMAVTALEYAKTRLLRQYEPEPSNPRRFA